MPAEIRDRINHEAQERGVTTAGFIEGLKPGDLRMAAAAERTRLGGISRKRRRGKARP